MGQNLSKTAALVGSCWSAVVGIYLWPQRSDPIEELLAEIAGDVDGGSDRKALEYTVCHNWLCMGLQISPC